MIDCIELQNFSADPEKYKSYIQSLENPDKIESLKETLMESSELLVLVSFPYDDGCLNFFSWQFLGKSRRMKIEVLGAGSVLVTSKGDYRDILAKEMKVRHCFRVLLMNGLVGQTLSGPS